MNATQARALALVVVAVVDAIKAAGPSGAPGGTLYAALMTQGCTLGQFESLMAALVSTGRVQKRGELYFVGGAS